MKQLLQQIADLNPDMVLLYTSKETIQSLLQEVSKRFFERISDDYFAIILLCSHFCIVDKVCYKRPFPSSPRSLCQTESKCEIFVMVISSNFNMNEN